MKRGIRRSLPFRVSRGHFGGGGFRSLNSHDSILSRHIPSEVKSVFLGIFFRGEKTRSFSQVFGYL